MGAWIETVLAIIHALLPVVAPRMGAWIETLQTIYTDMYNNVAPRMGAWIETFRSFKSRQDLMSRPAWARGLKLKLSYGCRGKGKSRAPHGRVD